MKTEGIKRAEWPGLLARCALGILFIFMGLSKGLDPVGFLKLVRQYELPVPFMALNTIAATLPWFEAFCGVLLLLGVAVRGTALMLVMMLIPFTAVVMHRALDIAGASHLAFCAVKFDCGCGAGEVFICAKVLENCLMTLLCFWLISGAGKRLALRYQL